MKKDDFIEVYSYTRKTIIDNIKMMVTYYISIKYSEESDSMRTKMFNSKLSNVLRYVDPKSSEFNKYYIIDKQTGKLSSENLYKNMCSKFTSNIWEDLNKKEQLTKGIKIVEQTNSNERCQNCGKKAIIVTSKQLRSADEPETIFHRCIECGFSRKYN